jgi:hypothetical protein
LKISLLWAIFLILLTPVLPQAQASPCVYFAFVCVCVCCICVCVCVVCVCVCMCVQVYTHVCKCTFAVTLHCLY